MKKHIGYLALSVLVLSLLACDLQIPTGVRIVGSPNFSVNYELNLSEHLGDLIASVLPEDEDLTIIRCTNTQIMTFMIHFNAMNQEFEIPDDAISELLGEVGDIVDTFVEESVDTSELFPDEGGEVDAEALAEVIGDLMNEVNDTINLAALLPDTFEWMGVDVSINNDSIMDRLFSDETADKIVENILNGQSTEDAINNAIKDAVREAVFEAIAAIEIVADQDIELINTEEDKFTLPLEGIGDILKGFSIADLDARVYLTVTDENGRVPDFLSRTEVVLSFDNEIDDVTITSFGSGSNVNLSNSTYGGTALPNPTGGFSLTNIIDNLLNLEQDVNIWFKAVLKGGNEGIALDFLGRDLNIKAEIVIWLPLSLQAGSSPTEFSFSIGEGANDLFNRSSASDFEELGDYIKSLTIRVGLSDPVFSGLEIVLANQTAGSDLEFRFPISGTNLEFSIDENKLAELNSPENFPFVPEIRIEINPNATLSIPRNLSVVNFALEADLEYYIPL